MILSICRTVVITKIIISIGVDRNYPFVGLFKGEWESVKAAVKRYTLGEQGNVVYKLYW